MQQKDGNYACRLEQETRSCSLFYQKLYCTDFAQTNTITYLIETENYLVYPQKVLYIDIKA